jgi:hypothetical protein
MATRFQFADRGLHAKPESFSMGQFRFVVPMCRARREQKGSMVGLIRSVFPASLVKQGNNCGAMCRPQKQGDFDELAGLIFA